jgi:hypothetical protein
MQFEVYWCVVGNSQDRRPTALRGGHEATGDSRCNRIAKRSFFFDIDSAWVIS